ncbi:hypothetical protein OAS47_01005 [Pelagibacteraceae bacterium]|nr:hypothetical protein [Pelagibacteraceae bacterium]
MKKIFVLLSLLFLLNGCVESLAIISSSVGGAASGRTVQSTLNSAVSYGIKKQTGKTPLGHALAYAEEKNPQKKKEPCISFVEKTKSEFCTVIKKQITSTNIAIKEKVSLLVAKTPKIKNKAVVEKFSQPKPILVVEDKNLVHSKKSSVTIAMKLQAEIKKIKDNKFLNQHLLRR